LINLMTRSDFVAKRQGICLRATAEHAIQRLGAVAPAPAGSPRGQSPKSSRRRCCDQKRFGHPFHRSAFLAPRSGRNDMARQQDQGRDMKINGHSGTRVLRARPGPRDLGPTSHIDPLFSVCLFPFIGRFVKSADETVSGLTLTLVGEPVPVPGISVQLLTLIRCQCVSLSIHWQIREIGR